MRRWLLDLLKCPKCGHYPLKLKVYAETIEELPSVIGELPLCKIYCAFVDGPPDEMKCPECIKKEVVAGVLICEVCGSRYGIDQGVPRL